MKKPVPHIISEYKVWSIECVHVDTVTYGDGIFMRTIWADNADLAKKYLLMYLKGKSMEVTILSVHPIINGRYEQTLNCELNDPERYHSNHINIMTSEQD